MRHLSFITIAALLLVACGERPETAPGAGDPAVKTAGSAAAATPYPGFIDYEFLKPGYQGETFVLSKDYPRRMPDTPRPAFFRTDFRKDWKTYLMQVREYCFAGNTAVDFRVEKNPVRRWYHMPWQAYGPLGREGIHGLTKEAGFRVRQLGPTQTFPSAGAWAVGFYNDYAGYTIGQVWKDPQRPDLTITTLPAGGFPEGSVLFKLLFASFPADQVVEQVPYLVNPMQWQAFVEPIYQNDPSKPGVRAVVAVSLIQMDIMVKDSRATESHGWVFGNYQYNGALTGKPAYENLVPLGIMWGNDPQVTGNEYTNLPPLLKTKINPGLTQTVINPGPELPLTHLGWNGRLNGPADNPQSSCYSCHMTAEYPAYSPMNPTFQAPDKVPPVGSPAWMRWFQNLPCGQPFDGSQPGRTPDSLSCDASLQLAGAVQNFHTWKQSQTAGLTAKPAAASAPVFPVVRDHHPRP